MTPMVGLGFILLAFFLHGAANRPHLLQLTMPAVAPPDLEGCICTRRLLTILLGPAHRVYYYEGLYKPADPTMPVPVLHATNLSAHGIRQTLLARGRQFPEPAILIASTPGARYQDMVDIIDEMNLTNQRRYALVALRPADRQLLVASELR